MQKLKNNIKIEVRQHDFSPGFAAYLSGSLKAVGKAHVVLNIGGIAGLVNEGQVKPKEVPYFVAELLMHEIIHVLEDWATGVFSEKKVHRLIDQYCEKYGNVTERMKKTRKKKSAKRASK